MVETESRRPLRLMAQARMAKMLTTKFGAFLLSELSVWAGTLGMCALALFVAPAAASERANGRASGCSHLGEGFRPIEGVDGCFRIGGHVRVEAGVMRGAGSLSRVPDGPAPAGFGGPFGGRLRASPAPQAIPR